MNTLRLILLINAASCLAFGSLFVISPANVTSFLGEGSAIVTEIVGLGLLVNGVHLLWVSRNNSPKPWEIIWFSLGDFAWWLATLLLIAANIWITTTIGVVFALIVGTGVAVLGVMQLWELGVHRYNTTNGVYLKMIGKSWLALPMWIKIWLTILNLVFLSVFAYWPEQIAIISLLAYVAAIPLMCGQIAFDGGLRRILGIGHLIPWLPLMVWLLLYAEQTFYVAILSIVLAICLVLDLIDVWRFWRGERNIIRSHLV